MSLTEAETRKLVQWVETAFQRCASRGDNAGTCGPYETPEQCRARILEYGTGFGRILRGKADYYVAPPELLDDLYGLMKKGCPARDIVELMLGCTNWFGGDISDFVEAVGVPEKLNTLRTNCRQMTEAI